MNLIEQFVAGGHSFGIVAAESCMIQIVTLIVTVECGHGVEKSPEEIPIFEITQGDHVWNTLVGGGEQSGILDLAPLVPYLRACTDEFARDYPEPLRFGSAKKAAQFATDIVRRPLNLRSDAYRAPYPGSAIKRDRTT